MELKDFTGRPCNSGLAFEFLPRHKITLDLHEIATRLKNKKFRIDIETPVFLSIRVGEKNTSLFKSGKIMVKETRVEQEARTAADTLVKEL